MSEIHETERIDLAIHFRSKGEAQGLASFIQLAKVGADAVPLVYVEPFNAAFAVRLDYYESGELARTTYARNPLTIY